MTASAFWIGGCLAAAASGVSLNSFITEALKEHLESVNA
jgi:predicted HicB family RNase H-like nuclease